MLYKKGTNLTVLGVFVMFLFLFTPSKFYSQEYTLDNQKSSLIVYGTSNIHDWEIETENQKGSIILSTVEKLQIKKLSIVIDAESLKSGKSGMDKNTYKALNTKKFKTIEFQYVSTDEVTDLKNGDFKIKTIGDLTVSGVTKRVPLDFNLNINNNTVTIIGEKSIKMTDYSVDPPTALLGTIKTGNELIIKFNSILK